MHQKYLPSFAKRNGRITNSQKKNLELFKSFEIKNFLKDHRIFFLACIAALTLGGKWKINDKKSANTSFPNFLKIIKMIGGQIN